jgi:GT2 family glycosyltransferase
MISIVTPWHNCSELCDLFERSHGRAEIISVDNASLPAHAIKIQQMTQRMGGQYLRNRTNNKFSKANNQGYKLASHNIVVFLNNDTMANSGWVFQVEDDVKDGALYGVSMGVRMAAGKTLPYIEGWCIAATKATWERVGLWYESLSGMYWEDNILSLQAMKAGVRLQATNWQVQHINNYTTNRTPNVLDSVAENQAIFEKMAKEWKQ